MAALRKPLQGVQNIVRFNWQYYVVSVVFVFVLFFLGENFQSFSFLITIIILLTATSIVVSLMVSLWIYDLSNLYSFEWLDFLEKEKPRRIVNVHAGFDETSYLLHERYRNAELLVYDFYDRTRHTEISIERARKAYPPFPQTEVVSTSSFPLNNASVDRVFVILAAHEIRDRTERVLFFKELKRVLDDEGEIVVTEHLRDIANLLAYNIGILHFYSRETWLGVFNEASLEVQHEIKITPFVSTFILRKNGIAS